jgi:hypothetical protein
MLMFGSKPILLELPVEFLLYPTHKLLHSKLLFGSKPILSELLVAHQLHPIHKL